MTYPTISVSLNDERLKLLSEVLRALREHDETISRSEAIGRAIELFHPTVCPSKGSDANTEGQKEAA